MICQTARGPELQLLRGRRGMGLFRGGSTVVVSYRAEAHRRHIVWRCHGHEHLRACERSYPVRAAARTRGRTWFPKMLRRARTASSVRWILLAICSSRAVPRSLSSSSAQSRSLGLMCRPVRARRSRTKSDVDGRTNGCAVSFCAFSRRRIALGCFARTTARSRAGEFTPLVTNGFDRLHFHRAD
jgi:hypothetical protein